jgi:glycine dehydrogenase subunit 1
MICGLTGLGVANASLYEGGTALYEAALMAERITRRRRIVVCGTVNPRHRSVLKSYGRIIGHEIVEVPHAAGRSDRAALEAALDEQTAAVLVQNPNAFGGVEDFTSLADACHAQKAVLVMSVYPVSLGILKTPGEMGADIACGEGQSLGIALQYGGPYLGFLAAKAAYVRRMPGRICGATADAAGQRGFTLTLQTREQHIRREKATSNICTNQALCALAACLYLTFIGKEGLREVATRCLRLAEHAKAALTEVPGVSLRFAGPTFNEFVLKLPKPAKDMLAALRTEHHIIGGYDLGRDDAALADCLLVCTTEKHTARDIADFAGALRAVL